MGQHDVYGKEIFKDILNNRWSSPIPTEQGGVKRYIDGLIKSNSGEASQCIVEIVAAEHKQISGALINLALYEDAKKKLLVLIPARLSKDNWEEKWKNWAEKWTYYCNFVWKRITDDTKHQDFGIVCLNGTGKFKENEKDKERISEALKKLGVL